MVSLATVAKEQLITLYKDGEVVASFKSSEIVGMDLDYAPSIFYVDERGVHSDIISWNKEMNTVIFTVDPKELLEQYTPTYELSENLEPYAHNGKVMEVDKENGLVYVYFSTPREVGEGSVTVTLGDGDEAEKCVVHVNICPSFQSVTFYGETAGPDIASKPYLDGRPKLGLLSMYWALNCEKTIDVNSEDEVRVAMNVTGGEMADILEAVKCYDWELVNGDALIVTKDEHEIVENNGFDAILGVRSGTKTGDVVFRCNTPCINYVDQNPAPISLTLTYHVVDIKKTYPVHDITVSNDNI